MFETQLDPTGFPNGGEYRGGNNINPDPSNIVKWVVGLTGAYKLLCDTFKRGDTGNLNLQVKTRVESYYYSPQYSERNE